MNVILFLIVGLISGWIASLLMTGRGLGALGDVAVGLFGAVLGGSLLNGFGVITYGFWPAVGTSVIGAVLFLAVVALFSEKKQPPRPLT